METKHQILIEIFCRGTSGWQPFMNNGLYEMIKQELKQDEQEQAVCWNIKELPNVFFKEDLIRYSMNPKITACIGIYSCFYEVKYFYERERFVRQTIITPHSVVKKERRKVEFERKYIIFDYGYYV